MWLKANDDNDRYRPFQEHHLEGSDGGSEFDTSESYEGSDENITSYEITDVQLPDQEGITSGELFVFVLRWRHDMETPAEQRGGNAEL